MPVAGYFFAWLAHFTVEKNAEDAAATIEQIKRRYEAPLLEIFP